VSGLDEPYVLAVARSVARSLKAGLSEKVVVAVYEFNTGTLLEQPSGSVSGSIRRLPRRIRRGAVRIGCCT
jgi:hypothetical protein